MKKLKNSEIFRRVLHALFNTAGRRTSESFSITIIGAILKTLQQKYDFLVYVDIDPKAEKLNDIIRISKELDTIHPVRIAKAVEAIVRVIYMDLRSKAGLFFINELKKNAGLDVITELRNLGVDLDLLQIEQHYLYRRFARSLKPTKDQLDNQTMLGYSWKDVGSWKYDEDSKTCVLFDGDGKELDKLYLETIIKKHVGFLTEDDAVEPAIDSIPTDITEKELEFLKLLKQRDMDFETAIVLLHVSEQQLHVMVDKLLKLEMLQYVSHNEISITEIGQNWLKEKEEDARNLMRIG